MKEFRAFFFSLAGILAIIAAIYQSRVMPLLFAALVLCALLSLLFALAARSALRVSARPREVHAERGEKVLIDVTVVNRSLMGLAPLYLDCRVQDGNGTLPYKVAADVHPFGRITFPLEYTMPHRGLFTVGAEKAAVLDFFKIFSLARRVAATGELLVLPRTIACPVDFAGKAAEAEEEISRRPGFETAPSGEYREYRDGDPMKSVHWKLSSKYDNQLIVRGTRSGSDGTATVCVDFSARLSGEELYEATDIVIENALAILREALTCGMSSELCTPEGNYLINNYEAYMSAFHMLARRETKVCAERPSFLPGKVVYYVASGADDDLLRAVDALPKKRTVLLYCNTAASQIADENVAASKINYVRI